MHLFAAPVPAGKKALEHETAYRLLAYAVQEVYGLPLPEIACDSRGKPFFPQRQEICFNLSHCRGLAVCGISAFPLGVDCESIRSLREGVLGVPLHRRRCSLSWKAPSRTKLFSGSGR